MNAIQDETLIGDILSQFPEAAEIMERYGLHCTDCSVNAFEPVRAGALSHGLDEEIVDEMMQELNELAKKSEVSPDEILLTPRAIKQVKSFAESEGKEGWALRITAKDNKGKEPAYAMDFAKAEKEDKVFEFDGLSVLLSPESFKNLKGSRVDYLESQFGSGFKIDNPNFKKGGCCGGGSCGSGGCGGGACGCSH